MSETEEQVERVRIWMSQTDFEGLSEDIKDGHSILGCPVLYRTREFCESWMQKSEAEEGGVPVEIVIGPPLDRETIEDLIIDLKVAAVNLVGSNFDLQYRPGLKKELSEAYDALMTALGFPNPTSETGSDE